MLILILLTSKIATCANDSALGLILIEKGFPEVNLAGFVIFQLPVDIAVSILISWYCRRQN